MEHIKVDENESGDKTCVSRCEKRDGESSRRVAAGGFACELHLYRSEWILDEDNNPIAEKTFIDLSQNYAHHDKDIFFGANLRVDGLWPEENDRLFIEFAHLNCVPIIERVFLRMQPLVELLRTQFHLDRNQIEAGLNGK